MSKLISGRFNWRNIIIVWSTCWTSQSWSIFFHYNLRHSQLQVTFRIFPPLQTILTFIGWSKIFQHFSDDFQMFYESMTKSCLKNHYTYHYFFTGIPCFTTSFMQNSKWHFKILLRNGFCINFEISCICRVYKRKSQVDWPS